MGGAFAAVADDGSALFYNPAGIAFQPGFRMQMDGVFVHGEFRFTPSAVPAGTIVPEKGYDGFRRPRVLVLPNMFMTKAMGPKWTLGFGAFAPFGLGGNWTDFKDGDPANIKFVARFHTSRPKMESIWFQPTAAYRLNDRMSIAVGVAWVHTHVLLEQSIINPYAEGVVFGQQLAPAVFPNSDPAQAAKVIARLLPEGRSRLAGTSNNIGGSLGFLYRDRKGKYSFGASYRTAVVQHFKAKASFAFTTDYPLRVAAGPEVFAALFPNQDVRAQLTTPGTYIVGVSRAFARKTLVAVDFKVQDYRRMKDVVINFSRNQGTVTPAEVRQQFDFHNAYAVHAGFERVMKGMSIRGGWTYDGTPVPEKSVSPLWPDSSRLNFTAGASRRKGNKEFSLFYQFTHFLTRTTDVAANAAVFTNGVWRSRAHLAGISMRMQLGVKEMESR
jgi:long-chain fatty acid transport protein